MFARQVEAALSDEALTLQWALVVAPDARDVIPETRGERCRCRLESRPEFGPAATGPRRTAMLAVANGKSTEGDLAAWVSRRAPRPRRSRKAT